MIKIIKNVPAPEQSRGTKKYPFSDMDVGDSIHLSCDEYDSKDMHNARCLAHQHGKRHGKKFTTKVEDDGLKIWRIA